MAEERRKKTIRFFTVVLVAVVSFIVGTRYETVFATISPIFGVKRSHQVIDLASVQETYRQLAAYYDGKLDTQQLIYGANRGLVEAAGDEHTAYMDPAEAEEFRKSLSGAIGGGIGAEIGLRNNKPIIVKSLKDSPAQKADIKEGDAILRVNGEDAANWTVEKTVEKIRGEVGTSVKLTLQSKTDTREVSVVRQNIVAPAVEATIDGDIGVLKISRFGDDTVSAARKAAYEFTQKNIKKVVLDLRNNPGGTVSSAQGVLGIWLNNQVVLTERRGSQVVKTLKSSGVPLFANVKTVVLINDASASASEIVAGALRDYNMATLVGKKSYGKGSVQGLFDVSGGSQLKITEARWYTPKGKNIDKEGIRPDVEVELTTEDIQTGKDSQMDKAKVI